MSGLSENIEEEVVKKKRKYKKRRRTAKKKKKTVKKKRRSTKQGFITKYLKERTKAFKEGPRYKLITVSNGRHSKTLGQFDHIDEARSAMKKAVKENAETVKLPRKWVKYHGDLFEAHDEIYIVKRRSRRDKILTTELRNEYGVLVEHSEVTGDWIPLEKDAWFVESTFWVINMNPYNERKDVTWIIDTLIKRKPGERKTPKRIRLYKYFVLIGDKPDLTIIRCKNFDERRYLYNMLWEFCSHYKTLYSNIMFCGDIKYVENNRKWLKWFAEETGFPKDRIQKHLK